MASAAGPSSKISPFEIYGKDMLHNITQKKNYREMLDQVTTSRK